MTTLNEFHELESMTIKFFLWFFCTPVEFSLEKAIIVYTDDAK